MAQKFALRHETDENLRREAQLIAQVLDGVTSDHSRRFFRTGLAAFFAWVVLPLKRQSFNRVDFALRKRIRNTVIGPWLARKGGEADLR